MTKLISSYINGWVGNAERGGMELGSADYALIGGDLRHWDNIADRLAYHGFQSE